MKKAITLALVLVLTFLCGMQIVADSAGIMELAAVCPKSPLSDGSHYFEATKRGSYGHSAIDKYSHSYSVDYDNTCIYCGYSYYTTEKATESHQFELVDIFDYPGNSYCYRYRCPICGYSYDQAVPKS